MYKKVITLGQPVIAPMVQYYKINKIFLTCVFLEPLSSFRWNDTLKYCLSGKNSTWNSLLQNWKLEHLHFCFKSATLQAYESFHTMYVLCLFVRCIMYYSRETRVTVTPSFPRKIFACVEYFGQANKEQSTLDWIQPFARHMQNGDWIRARSVSAYFHTTVTFKGWN